MKVLKVVAWVVAGIILLIAFLALWVVAGTA